MKWRLNFDVPVTYAIEPGYRRAVHCSDFRGHDLDQSLGNVWRDPVTGLLLLKPSFLTRGFYSDFKDIGQFDKQSDFWLPSSRAVDNAGNGAPMLTSVLPADKPHTLIELLVDIGITAINALANVDELVWALQSQFTLGADEALCLHYHGLADEMLRFENWFTIHWDNISVNISQTGVCRIYRYSNRADLTTGYSLVEEFTFGSPGDLVGSHGYFYLQPIPGYGLLFHHSRRTPKVDVLSSTANIGASFGHLVKWPTHAYTPSGSETAQTVLFEPSKVTIGVNPHMPHLLGYQSVTFPTAGGTFTDSPFDPQYPPSTLPAGVQPALVTTAQTAGSVTGATATLRKPDSSGAWAVGDRQGRVKIALTTSDARYTPFVAGYAVGWNPVTTTRATMATPPSKFERLEFSEDEYARWEGTADVLMETGPQRLIAERGDTTMLVEKSVDGTTWATVNGGIAKFTEIEAMYAPRPGVVSFAGTDTAVDPGWYYRCAATLCDNHERFREVFDTLDTAFDAEALIDAFNSVLLTTGFNPLLSYPADLPAITLPPVGAGQTWQISPREGESSEQILETFLLFLRRQNVEYRLRYDWDAHGWRIEYKPRDTSDGAKWTLTAFSDEHNPASRIARYQSLRILPEPPEANRTYVYGTTSNVPGAERVVSAPLTNQASLTDTTSVDYAGRVKILGYKAVGITDQAEINRMNRRVFDAVAHRRLKMKIEAPDYVDALIPNTQVDVRGLDATGNRATLFTAWVKKRTVLVENEDQETVTYTLDTNWVGELQQ